MRCNDNYTLPQISFVAGQSKTLAFNLWTISKHRYNASDCTGNFAIVNYSDKTSTPLVSKSMTFEVGEDEDIYSVATVELESSDTLDLYGKYIYQLTIKDIDGNAEIPNQGIFLITNNINKSFLR